MGWMLLSVSKMEQVRYSYMCALDALAADEFTLLETRLLNDKGVHIYF